MRCASESAGVMLTACATMKGFVKVCKAVGAERSVGVGSRSECTVGNATCSLVLSPP